MRHSGIRKLLSIERVQTKEPVDFGEHAGESIDAKRHRVNGAVHATFPKTLMYYRVTIISVFAALATLLIGVEESVRAEQTKIVNALDARHSSGKERVVNRRRQQRKHIMDKRDIRLFACNDLQQLPLRP